MDSSFAVMIAGAVLIAAAALWVLRAYRRGDGRVSARPALIVCGIAACATLTLYLAIGRPDLPDAAYAARLEALRQRDPQTYSAEEGLVVFAEMARARPSDPTPHLLTGDLELRVGRPEHAARAFQAALRRDPASAEAMLGLGTALAMIDGHATPDAVRLFEAAAIAAPTDPDPWILQAMAAAESGEDARPLWGEALARMAADDPRRTEVARLSRTAGR